MEDNGGGLCSDEIMMMIMICDNSCSTINTLIVRAYHWLSFIKYIYINTLSSLYTQLDPGFPSTGNTAMVPGINGSGWTTPYKIARYN